VGRVILVGGGNSVTLKGVTNEKNGGSNVAAIHRYWPRTVVIDVHFNFDWAVVFYFVYFRFHQVLQNL